MDNILTPSRSLSIFRLSYSASKIWGSPSWCSDVLIHCSPIGIIGYHQEAGNFWQARSSWQYWWDTKLHVLLCNTYSWESQQLTSVNCWLCRWKNVSTFQIFFVFLGLRIFTRIYCIWSETREQNLNDLLSYNGPQFLIKNRFTYPNDLQMTSNSLFFWLFLIYSPLFDQTSTAQIKNKGIY